MIFMGRTEEAAQHTDMGFGSSTMEFGKQHMYYGLSQGW